MSYDNTHNGALFPTNDEGILSGPFQTENDAGDVRIVCYVNGHGEGRHTIKIFQKRKDNRGLKAKPLAEGFIAKATHPTKVVDPDDPRNSAPAARGFLANGKKRVPLVLWKLRDPRTGGTFYQVKPDELQAEAPADVPEL